MTFYLNLSNFHFNAFFVQHTIVGISFDTKSTIELGLGSTTSGSCSSNLVKVGFEDRRESTDSRGAGFVIVIGQSSRILEPAADRPSPPIERGDSLQY